MTYEQAQQILNRVRDGATYPSRLVDYALYLTGDFDAYEAKRGQGMVESVSAEDERRWSHASKGVVERRYWGH